MSRVFLDTNFFVYASDDGAPGKRDRARQLWSEMLVSADLPVISTQVLQEYYNILTHKLRLRPADARTKVLLLGNIDTVLINPVLIEQAMDLHGRDTISFWDALIISAAQSVDCDEIWTEDMQTNRSYGKLKIVNPFSGT